MQNKKLILALLVLTVGLFIGVTQARSQAKFPELLVYAKAGRSDSLQAALHATPSAKIDALNRQALLTAAMDSGNASSVKAILQWGVDANELLRLKQDGETVEVTPLLYAISSKASLTVVEQLMVGGADANRSASGLIPLNFALSMRQYTVAEYLLNHKAKADAVEESGGMTPLINLAMSAKGADDQVLRNLTKLLLASGAQVNAKAARQTTALTFAVLGGNPLMARLLLEAGADVNASNERGETPIAIARKKGLNEVVNVLAEFGGR